jgi:hypothetical protein
MRQADPVEERTEAGVVSQFRHQEIYNLYFFVSSCGNLSGPIMKIRRLVVSLALLGLALSAGTGFAAADELRFEVSFPSALRSGPLTGRVFVMMTQDAGTEPRFQAGARYMGCPFFGLDVEGLVPGAAAVIDGSTPGYPVRSLREIPPGEYYVQAFINIYTEFRRADGHTLWLHEDQWEGQHMFVSPGNLYSDVRRVHLDPSGGAIKLEASRAIPAVTLPPDTKWVKRLKIRSELLTKFWGRPMYLGAVILLPRGYDENPDTFYPVVYEQEHFKLGAPYDFRTEPPNPAEPLLPGSTFPGPEAGYKLYKEWIADDFPRLIIVLWLHPTPYYDDSYAMNSANNGPYGDAIMNELVPYIESRFRVVRRPYARVLTGGSTGGWEALALQVRYPEFFGGARIFYPDPVDFRRWGLTNIYEDENAFSMAPATAERLGSTPWQPVRRPFIRLPDGQMMVTQEEASRLETVLGSKCRSGEQTDAWFSTYGPVGGDGYPRPLWDKATGKIDRGVAEYMRANGYDLVHYLRTQWPRLGKHLVGKLHFYVGDMDHYYLNLAVYLAEEFLESTKDPHYGGAFTYGRPLKGHMRPQSIGTLLREIAEAIARHRPAGEPAPAWK